TCRWSWRRNETRDRRSGVGDQSLAPDPRSLTPEVDMPKQKSKRALRKRVKLTGRGRLRRYHAYKSHILTKKHPKRKRHLRKPTLVSHADERRLKRLLMAQAATHAQRPDPRRAPHAPEQDREARQR